MLTHTPTSLTTAWWFSWYMRGLFVWCALTGTEPDLARFTRVALRALRLNGRPLGR